MSQATAFRNVRIRIMYRQGCTMQQIAAIFKVGVADVKKIVEMMEK